MSSIPTNLKYLESHEWVRAEADGTVTVKVRVAPPTVRLQSSAARVAAETDNPAARSMTVRKQASPP